MSAVDVCPKKKLVSDSARFSTLDFVFSVTYYLELRNAITVCCISHFLPTKVKLVVWRFFNNNIFTLS